MTSAQQRSRECGADPTGRADDSNSHKTLLDERWMLARDPLGVPPVLRQRLRQTRQNAPNTPVRHREPYF